MSQVKDPAKSAKDAPTPREARLKAQLRANLARRKAGPSPPQKPEKTDPQDDG